MTPPTFSQIGFLDLYVLGLIHIKQKLERKRNTSKNSQKRSNNKRQTSNKMLVFSFAFATTIAVNVNEILTKFTSYELRWPRDIQWKYENILLFTKTDLPPIAFWLILIRIFLNLILKRIWNFPAQSEAESLLFSSLEVRFNLCRLISDS